MSAIVGFGEFRESGGEFCGVSNGVFCGDEFAVL